MHYFVLNMYNVRRSMYILVVEMGDGSQLSGCMILFVLFRGCPNFLAVIECRKQSEHSRAWPNHAYICDQ